MSELSDEIKSAGPKRVRTKEIEVEAHDPLKVLQAKERLARKPVLFSQFPMTLVKPKPNDKARCCKVDRECCE